MARSTNPERFLTDTESATITTAVREAERFSSAELKVVLARHCWGNLKRKARKLFKELGLEGTERRNCVLILLVTTNRECLIYGDEGIHTKVGQGFWDDVLQHMQNAFGQDAFGEGIAEAVRQIGTKLADHFPCQANDIDEISNEIVYHR